jgi:hypothetical protein
MAYPTANAEQTPAAPTGSEQELYAALCRQDALVRQMRLDGADPNKVAVEIRKFNELERAHDQAMFRLLEERAAARRNDHALLAVPSPTEKVRA